MPSIKTPDTARSDRDDNEYAPSKKKKKPNLSQASRLCHDEILIILQFLHIKDIANCLLVDKNWKIVGSSNIIWKPLYDKFFMNNFFEWDKQLLKDASNLDDDCLVPLYDDEIAGSSFEYDKDDDEDCDEDEGENCYEENHEKHKLEELEKKEFTSASLENIKDKNGVINYYRLFQYDCHYPQINESCEDIITKLRNIDSITDVDTLRQLIKHIWRDSTDSDNWKKIIGTPEMVLDKSNRLWKRRSVLVFTAMVLLILFDKKRINYLDSIINVTGYYQHNEPCEMPILAFCKMISSNRSNIAKVCAKYGIKKGGVGAKLKVSDLNGKKENFYERNADVHINILEKAFSYKKSKDTYVASQQNSDFLNPETEEFAPSFFNAGSQLICFQCIRAKIVDNFIKFELDTSATYH